MTKPDRHLGGHGPDRHSLFGLAREDPAQVPAGHPSVMQGVVSAAACGIQQRGRPPRFRRARTVISPGDRRPATDRVRSQRDLAMTEDDRLRVGEELARVLPAFAPDAAFASAAEWLAQVTVEEAVHP